MTKESNESDLELLREIGQKTRQNAVALDLTDGPSIQGTHLVAPESWLNARSDEELGAWVIEEASKNLSRHIAANTENQ